MKRFHQSTSLHTFHTHKKGAKTRTTLEYFFNWKYLKITVIHIFDNLLNSCCIVVVLIIHSVAIMNCLEGTARKGKTKNPVPVHYNQWPAWHWTHPILQLLIVEHRCCCCCYCYSRCCSNNNCYNQTNNNNGSAHAWEKFLNNNLLLLTTFSLSLYLCLSHSFLFALSYIEITWGLKILQQSFIRRQMHWKKLPARPRDWVRQNYEPQSFRMKTPRV